MFETEKIISLTVCAAIGIFFYRFKNPQKEYLNTFSIFLFGLVSSVFFSDINILNYTIWTISSLGLMVAYYLRFRLKPKKAVTDYVKWIALPMLLLYFLFLILEEKIHYPFYNAIVLWLILTTYIYDRWILKPEIMRKRFIIALSLQSAMLLFFLIYAVTQTIAANEAKMAAAKNLESCERLKIELERIKVEQGK